MKIIGHFSYYNVGIKFETNHCSLLNRQALSFQENLLINWNQIFSPLFQKLSFFGVRVGSKADDHSGSKQTIFVSKQTIQGESGRSQGWKRTIVSGWKQTIHLIRMVTHRDQFWLMVTHHLLMVVTFASLTMTSAIIPFRGVTLASLTWRSIATVMVTHRLLSSLTMFLGSSVFTL